MQTRIRARIWRSCLWASLVVLALPLVLRAGTTEDTDADLVPDELDSCLEVANGPNEGCNAVDVDQDGYGDSCDADYDQDGRVTAADFGSFLAFFGASSPIHDHDCDGGITAADFGVYLSYFGRGVGQSGLACADPTIRVDLGDAPCRP